MKLTRLLIATGLLWASITVASARDDDQKEGTKAVELLKALIRIDTTNAPGDTTQIAQFLKSQFDELDVPTEIVVAPNGKAAHFFARLKGDGSLPPVLLAAHTDVVPANASAWSVDPFAAVERDGFVYGRGAYDNKASVAVFARGVMRLAENHVKLSRDVIFLAEADEEQGQFNTGWLAREHWAKMDAAFALNEGGRTYRDASGRVRQLNVSVADKITLTLRLTTRGPAGHSSMPPPAMTTANGKLIAALSKLTTYRGDVRLSPQIQQYFRSLATLYPGPLADGVEHIIAALDTAGRSAGADAILAASPDDAPALDALLRDTLAITMIDAGLKPNIIPGEASAIVNARLLPGASVDAFIEQLTGVIDDPGVDIEIVNSRPKPELAAFFRSRSAIQPSSIDTDLYSALQRSAKRVWPDAMVLPTLMVASTDATPWRERGIPVYGLAPFPSDDETFRRIHGDDERISVQSLHEGAQFVYEVLHDVASVRKRNR